MHLIKKMFGTAGNSTRESQRGRARNLSIHTLRGQVSTQGTWPEAEERTSAQSTPSRDRPFSHQHRLRDTPLRAGQVQLRKCAEIRINPRRRRCMKSIKAPANGDPLWQLMLQVVRDSRSVRTGGVPDALEGGAPQKWPRPVALAEA